ncbi:MAG TPA: hypothetical protein VN621_01715 [Arthrobacter sp.]|nr:hypothetical protein [Arthrobacter sp.]
MTQGKATYRDILPWVVAPEHKPAAIMWRFRTILKQREGREIPANEQRLLNNWLKTMKDSNVVVNYHPEAPSNAASKRGGFYYVERKASDDWIIRRPPTDGSKLENP